MFSYRQPICATCRRALRLQAQRRSITDSHATAAARRNLSSTSATSKPRTVRPLSTTIRPSNHTRTAELAIQSQSRTFSKSPIPAKVIQNPRFDEDGKEMLLRISPRASSRLKQISTKESSPQYLRISVESGGCHGFQYLMSLSSADKIDAADDTVIEADDGTGSKIVLDEPSLELLKGSKVDYTMELIGSQFKIVDNPAATSSCGCGTSFDIKAF